MGTTLTAALIAWPHLYIAHAGDSRCYVLRNGRLMQLTRDHTLSQLYRESLGEKARGEATFGESTLRDVQVARDDDSETGRGNNTLWNVVGSDNETVEPEVFRGELQATDVVLVCSDGLYKQVAPERIAERLGGGGSAQAACAGPCQRVLVRCAGNGNAGTGADGEDEY